MPARIVMLTGVASGRLVAAADVSARETEAEVEPRAARRETLLAADRPGVDVPGLVQVGARGSARSEQTREAAERVADAAHARLSQTGAQSATQSSTATATSVGAAAGRVRGRRTKATTKAMAARPAVHVPRRRNSPAA